MAEDGGSVIPSAVEESALQAVYRELHPRYRAARMVSGTRFPKDRKWCVQHKSGSRTVYSFRSLCVGLLTPHAMRPEVSNHFLRNDLIWSATGSPETTQSTTSRAVYRELHSRYEGSSDGFGNKIPETPRNLGLRMSGPLRGGKDSCLNDEQPTRLTSYLPWLIAGQMVAGFILVIAFLATKGVIADSSRKWLVMWVPVCWLMVPLTIGFYWDITPARTRVCLLALRCWGMP